MTISLRGIAVFDRGSEMLGIVFTEFAEMVEQEFSPDLLDELLTNLEDELPSNGVYTAVGKYHHTEMLQLVTHLSKMVDIPLPDLVRTYGRHLFGRFTVRYPMFFEDVSDSFDFLERVETHIHREVRKLYETSELPRFPLQPPGAKHAGHGIPVRTAICTVGLWPDRRLCQTLRRKSGNRIRGSIRRGHDARTL